MESTGVLWKPIYNLLEEDFTVYVVNARHIKAVPGRKTDVKDAKWLAYLLRHGLLRPSFVPDRSLRDLRELVRHCRSLIRQRSQVINHIQKVLEGANIKLSPVASNVVGGSGRAMLDALISGVEDPKPPADLTKGRLRGKLPSLEEAIQRVDEIPGIGRRNARRSWRRLAWTWGDFPMLATLPLGPRCAQVTMNQSQNSALSY
jgi:transposase